MEIVEVEESINTLEEENPENNIMEVPPTLTEAEQLGFLREKMSSLYKKAQYAAIAFFALSALLVTGFKLNESFFDANSRISFLMERLNEEQQKLLLPKLNVKANFVDEPHSRLAIRLAKPISTQNISVREEFTRNKLVITLLGASEDIGDGVDIVSDSTIMDAVGVYRQGEDVVVEVYCNDSYSWAMDNTPGTLSFSFDDIKNTYANTAVVYVPYEDKNHLVMSEWQQTLSRYAADNDLKLFLSYNMQESYTEQDVVEFANDIDADMLLGVSVYTDSGVTDESARIVCNSEYFIPDFGSTQLAIAAAEAVIEETRLSIDGFRECDDEDVLVKAAKIPAAAIEIFQPDSDAADIEEAYELNESIIETIKGTFAASAEYIGGLRQ